MGQIIIIGKTVIAKTLIWKTIIEEAIIGKKIIEKTLIANISKKWAFEFSLIIIDIKRFLTQGSENIKLYTGYAGYSKRFGVLHHHQLNMIDLYEAKRWWR